MLSPWLTLPLMLLLAGALLGTLTATLMLRMLLRPQRMTDGKAAFILRRLSPEDLGLRYRPLSFAVRDEATGRNIPIAAWWIPHDHARGRCAVLIHGFSDAKVGVIAWAPLFHALGFNIFAFDLRAHGESGGAHATGGYFERHDADQLLTQLRDQFPNDTRRIVLFGVSLGAAVAAAVALLRDDIDALLLECPYADFRRTALTHTRLLGVPGGPAARLVLWIAQKITGANYDQVRPVDMIRQIRCPLLIIRSENDDIVEPEDAAALRAAAEERPPELGPTEYWSIPDTRHVLGLHADPDLYRRKIESFLTAALESPDRCDVQTRAAP